MRRLRLTQAQASALECAGLEHPLDDGDVLVARRWSGDWLEVHDDEIDALVSALIELANAEDHVAEDRSRDPDERRGARGARTALSNLIAKI